MNYAESLLASSNREDGNWLPNVNNCPNTVKPCGNARPMDEAMRAGQIRAAGNGFIARSQAEHAIKQAKKICNGCPKIENGCPVTHAFNLSPIQVIDLIADFHSQNA